MGGIDLYNRLKDFEIPTIVGWQTIVLIFVILFLVVKFWNIVYAWFTKRKVIAKVITKDRVDYPVLLRSNYLIFTDKEVFKNADSIAYLNFSSSDMYGKIEEGKTYCFTVHGKRRKWRSGYRNIVKFEELKSPFYIIDKDKKPYKTNLHDSSPKVGEVIDVSHGERAKVISTPKKYDKWWHKILNKLTFRLRFNPRKEYIVSLLKQIV